VIVSGLSGRGKVRKFLFFPKSQIEDGTAPRWLVEQSWQQKRGLINLG
jgi:hypothetical protein